MAVEKNHVLTDSREAAADLSAKQFHFVKLDSTGKVNVCTAVTDVPYGVLQNDPTSGQMAEVVVIGITKVVADATLDEGNLIGTSADSQAQPLTVGTETTVYIVGQVRNAAANAGEIAVAVVNCAAPARAA